MVMKKVNVHEVKARLSEFLDAVEQGERVVICRRNRPVAELVRAASARSAPRPVGTAPGLELPRAFFDPLPADVEAGFYPGETVVSGGLPNVAEPRKPFGAKRVAERKRKPS